MFYVSQKPHIKWSPNGIKTDGELFWNIWDFPEEESTRNGVRGGHEIGGRALGGRAPHPREQGVGPLAFIFGVDFSLFLLRRSVEFQDFWSCAE